MWTHSYRARSGRAPSAAAADVLVEGVVHHSHAVGAVTLDLTGQVLDPVPMLLGIIECHQMRHFAVDRFVLAPQRHHFSGQARSAIFDHLKQATVAFDLGPVLHPRRVQIVDRQGCQRSVQPPTEQASDRDQIRTLTANERTMCRSEFHATA